MCLKHFEFESHLVMLYQIHFLLVVHYLSRLSQERSLFHISDTLFGVKMPFSIKHKRVSSCCLLYPTWKVVMMDAHRSRRLQERLKEFEAPSAAQLPLPVKCNLRRGPESVHVCSSHRADLICDGWFGGDSLLAARLSVSMLSFRQLVLVSLLSRQSLLLAITQGITRRLSRRSFFFCGGADQEK